MRHQKAYSQARHLTRAKRAMSRRRFRSRGRGFSLKNWILLGGAVLSLAFVGVAIGYQHAQPVLAKWMAVHRVVISGLQYVDRQEALSLLSLSPDASMLSINSSVLQSRLESHPWIATAAVGRVLPHTLTIVIRESRPTAVLEYSQGSLVLDEKAGVLPGISKSILPELPVLRGISVLGLRHGNKDVLDQAREGIKLARLLLQRFGSRPLVVVEGPQQFLVEVQDLSFRFKSGFEKQWEQFLAMESFIPPRLNVNGYEHEIDLRFPGKVIFRSKG